MSLPLSDRVRTRTACGACKALIDAGNSRCGWCGAVAVAKSAALAGGDSSWIAPPAQAFRRWDEKRSAIEMMVEASSSQAAADVKAAGGHPSDSPSRTTGTPSSTK